MSGSLQHAHMGPRDLDWQEDIHNTSDAICLRQLSITHLPALVLEALTGRKTFMGPPDGIPLRWWLANKRPCQVHKSLASIQASIGVPDAILAQAVFSHMKASQGHQNLCLQEDNYCLPDVITIIWVDANPKPALVLKSGAAGMMSLVQTDAI